MNYADLRKYDVSNWNGINSTLFVSGCNFHCKGCWNKEAQDFNYGKPHTREVEDTFIKYINDKITWCDAMIITSPVYSLQISGQLKNFIDHMSYNFHRPKYFNKKALIITTTGGVRAKEIANYIKEVLTFWGINTTYKLPIVYRDNNLEKYDKQIDKVLSKFIYTLKNEKIKAPTFKTVASYNSFRSMSTTLYTKGNPDYDYWKNSELYKYPYHPDVNIGKVKSVFGNALYKVISKRMKNNKDMKYNERKIKIIKRLPKEEGVNL